MISKMKATTFKTVNDEMWKEVAIQSLHGLPFEKLLTKTLDGIHIKPLYTKKDIEKLQTQHKAMLGTIRNGTSSDWTIAQQSYARDSEQFMKELTALLEKGNEAIVYDGRNRVIWEEEHLTELAALVQTYPLYAFYVEKNDMFSNVFTSIAKTDRKKVKGAFIGETTLPDGYELVRTIVADMTPIHYQGADIATELAVTLAKASEEASQFGSFASFSKQFFVRFSVDTHFFMEIAKIRAFRMLWQTLANSYGYERQGSVPVFSETSLRTYSKLDPYVNLLRAGNEAFSAVLGGTDILTVHPHDILAQITPTSQRIARNVQVVIKEETHVNDVLDPAGGSYYIDTLTNELIEKAWALFQQIELQGGYTPYVSSNALETRLKKLYDERISRLSHHQHSLIGTNKYADVSTPVATEKATMEVEGRLAQAYEELRAFFEQNQPKIVLLTFGELKDFKPRADFVTSFLAAGGLKVEWSPAFETVEQGNRWLKENHFDYGIICADTGEVESVMQTLVQSFPQNKWMDVAGSYDASLEEYWKEAGINGFIFKGQNQLAKLTAIRTRFEQEGRE